MCDEVLKQVKNLTQFTLYTLYIQDNISQEKLITILEELVSETCCPICFNTLRSPAHLCTNAHEVCAKCLVTFDKCPPSSQPFSAKTSNNELLIKVLDLLPYTQ